MYTRKEESELRQAFWTAFGHYMAPVASAEGTKINWINYKTGQKHLFFKMDAGKSFAGIAIELIHPDVAIQELYFEQFKQHKELLRISVGESWMWSPLVTGKTGKMISRIGKELSGVNVYDQKDWPAIISFLKPRLIGLDLFWSSVKWGFDTIQ